MFYKIIVVVVVGGYNKRIKIKFRISKPLIKLFTYT